MKEYFKDQLDTREPWTAEKVEQTIATGLADGTLKEEQVDLERERLNNHIGKKLVFFIVREEGLVSVLKAYDTELDELSEQYQFIREGVSFPEFRKK